jgi:hypothetical protein
MKSGSVEAFQVVVVCHETPPSQDAAQGLAADLRDDAFGQ